MLHAEFLKQGSTNRCDDVQRKRRPRWELLSQVRGQYEISVEINAPNALGQVNRPTAPKTIAGVSALARPESTRSPNGLGKARASVPVSIDWTCPARREMTNSG